MVLGVATHSSMGDAPLYFWQQTSIIHTQDNGEHHCCELLECGQLTKRFPAHVHHRKAYRTEKRDIKVRVGVSIKAKSKLAVATAEFQMRNVCGIVGPVLVDSIFCRHSRVYRNLENVT